MLRTGFKQNESNQAGQRFSGRATSRYVDSVRGGGADGAGVATLVGANLLLACLNRNLHPNWDAANPESARLAEKLGYRSVGKYQAFYHIQN